MLISESNSRKTYNDELSSPVARYSLAVLERHLSPFLSLSLVNVSRQTLRTLTTTILRRLAVAKNLFAPVQEYRKLCPVISNRAETRVSVAMIVYQPTKDFDRGNLIEVLIPRFSVQRQRTVKTDTGEAEKKRGRAGGGNIKSRNDGTFEPARVYSVKRDARLNTNTDIGFRKTLKQ